MDINTRLENEDLFDFVIVVTLILYVQEHFYSWY